MNRVKRSYSDFFNGRDTWRVTDCAPGRELIGGPVDRARASGRPSRSKSSDLPEAEAEIISRRGICSVIYYVANRAIKVNSAVSARRRSCSLPLSLPLCFSWFRSFLAVSRVLAKNFFVEFTKLIVWRRPIFSWLYAQLVDHLTISCLTCNSSWELSFSSSFSSYLSLTIVNCQSIVSAKCSIC